MDQRRTDPSPTNEDTDRIYGFSRNRRTYLTLLGAIVAVAASIWGVSSRGWARVYSYGEWGYGEGGYGGSGFPFDL